MNFCKNKNYKEFPEHRVCVIDFLPVLDETIKETYKFCYSVGLTQEHWSRAKKDILNIFYHYGLNKLCEAYKECPSEYRKVIATYSIAAYTSYPNALREGMLNVVKMCPLPWCRVSSFNSPELSLAAVNAFENKKYSYSKLLKIADERHLHVFAKKIKKNRIFSNITVDFSVSEK